MCADRFGTHFSEERTTMLTKYLAAFAVLIGISAPAVAFDDPLQRPSQGMMFYLSIPLDARDVKQNKLAYGMQFQGQRAYETVRVDTRMFDDDRTFNFFGTAIGVKWIVAGVAAAGAVAVVASKDKSTSNNQQQQQQQQQQAQQQQPAGGSGGTGGGTGGGTFHPDGSPHVPGDNCACHN
jgi:hypothetical protein